MAPKPNEYHPLKEELQNVSFGEKVVISGMSGLYPESRNLEELSEILYNKINPVNNENSRWHYDHPEVAQYTGKVPGLQLFDAQFFKVHYRMSNNTDPMARKIMEQSYQAIYDAGISPEQLSGKKVGVYIGSCFSETEKACFYVASSRTGFGIAGCSKTMFANRVSYWLNSKGPSMSVDDACCSSTAALELAYQAINRGECEAAIVGGSNLCLHPQSSIHYGRIMTLSMDGKTKSFDTNATGCAKSEAVNVLFLQKAKDALRIYAEVVHVKCEFTSILEGETGPKYGFYRDPLNMANFIEEFYKEAKVSPLAVEYVEAFGSAIPESDKSELEALDYVFCKDRKDPLLVGSVMSNIGYGEAASGISAITKVLLGYQKGKLAGNLNCESPRQDIDALREGRIRIITDHQSFSRAYTAINGISITGVNAHILLNGHYKPKDLSRYKSSIPNLVAISARQESSVKKIIEILKSRQVDPEELALLHNIHQTRISGHLGRGFTILDTDENNKTVCLSEKISYFDDAKRPLWFVYSGMGSQWSGMGAQLMRIPIFAAAIERCRKVLEPKGVDIVHIITSPDKKIFDNILHSFVGIAAIQIGLTDILRELEIFPDKIIGHSVGELGCAYADGCFTAEEMILAAYCRGLVSVQTPFIRGSMAAVGIGYQQISKMCPPEIEVACHNGPESSTISGPAEVMKVFVEQLTKKDIFAKEVPCSNIAYHSRYIAEAGPALLKYLKEVIPSPKPRSERWVSTSVPQDKWDEPIAKYSSAEYHTNNLLNSVLFEETSQLIPNNAVVVEIAPHGLLQAILKRSLPENCKHIPLTRRGHPDNAIFLLEAVGNLYMEGYNPKVQVLYPKIEFPVSTGTPMLSPLVEWAHHERWIVPLYVAAHRKTTASYKQILSIHDDEHSYLKGNVIRGKNVYPISGVLVVVWDTLAMIMNVRKKELSVQFSNVHLYSQPILYNQRQLKLSVSIQRGTGRFEVFDENIVVATGTIIGNLNKFTTPMELPPTEENTLLCAEDVYELLNTRDFDYSNHFRSIHSSNLFVTKAQLLWENNWVTFIDGMLQLNVLKRIHETVCSPNFIRSMTIDVNQHFQTEIQKVEGTSVMTATVSEVQDWTRCGGVLMENIKFQDLPESKTEIKLESLKFIPHFTNNKIKKDTAISCFLQTVNENLNKKVINVLNVSNNVTNSSNFEQLKAIAGNIKGFKANFSTITRENILEDPNNFMSDVDLLLINNLSTDDSICQILYRVLKRDAFVINVEEHAEETSSQRPSALYRVVCSHKLDNTSLELLLWRPSDTPSGTSAFTVLSESDMSSLNSSIRTISATQRLVILTSYPAVAGLKSLVKEWRLQGNRKINLVMINHKISDEQSIDQISFTNLALNILDHGIWGGEYFLPLVENTNKGHGAALDIARLGDLDSLQWIEASETHDQGIPVTVNYAGINDVDLKTKLGAFESINSQRIIDFSGKTESGTPVMGVVQGETIKTRVKARPELLWPVPKHWSMEDAATVPLAYVMAFYCLAIKSSMKAGTRILVHGGAGALGQAIISIALSYGCEVFTTVSDNKKKRFLTKLFPELKEDHIDNSRDIAFCDMVHYATKGDGCNLIISCVKTDLKDATLRCCRPSGVTIDTSVILNHEDFNFGMKYLGKGISYFAISLSELFDLENINEIKRVQVMMSEGIARGYVRPLSRVIYAPHEAPRAYRLLAGSNHRGRILLNLQEDVPYMQTNSRRAMLKSPPCFEFMSKNPEWVQNYLDKFRYNSREYSRISCSAERCHLVLSDDDIIGMRLAERLVSRGAKKLILHFPNKLNYILLRLAAWEKQGVNVKVSYGKYLDGRSMNKIIEENSSLGDIEGIYYFASPNKDKRRIAEDLKIFNSIKQEILLKIKIFAVAGENYANEELPVSLLNEKIPLTGINLPKSQDGEKNQNKIFSATDIVDAIEKALCSKLRFVIGHVNCKSLPLSLVENISRVAGIKIPKNVSGETTLKDLGVQPSKAGALCCLLRNLFNMQIEEGHVTSISVDTLRAWENKNKEREFEETKGLGTFFSSVDNDELLAVTDMVFLQSLTNSSNMRDDEFDVKQTYLCVVPGVESHHSRFRTLCERLKLPALVLQPDCRPHETIQEMALRLAKVLLKKTQLKKYFYLLGYESGVLVALEIAAILEEHGLTGTVFCIGGTPEEVQETFTKELSTFKTEETLQIEVIRHMLTLMNIDNTDDLEVELKDKLTWEEKVTRSVQILLGRIPHSIQYAKETIEAAYARIKQVRRYVSDLKPLRSLVVYMRSKSAVPNSTPLKVYSQQPVIEYELEVPLAHSTQDLRCSAIINRHLDKNILKVFESRNLLETYILNADSFMTNARDDI